MFRTSFSRVLIEVIDFIRKLIYPFPRLLFSTFIYSYLKLHFVKDILKFSRALPIKLCSYSKYKIYKSFGSDHLLSLSYLMKFKFIISFNFFNFVSFVILYVIWKCYSALRILSSQPNVSETKFYLWTNRSNKPYTSSIVASDLDMFKDKD